jgi:hypothetical protein
MGSAYDGLCERPAETLSRFIGRLKKVSALTDLDTRQLTVSHATAEKRPTIGSLDASGNVILTPIRPFDSEAWSQQVQASD